MASPKTTSFLPSQSPPPEVKNRKKKLHFLKFMTFLWNASKKGIDMTLDFVNKSTTRFKQTRKNIHEMKEETRQKVMFLTASCISTILFYILFECLYFSIHALFEGPSSFFFGKFFVSHAFSISWVIAYMTSVIWQHLLNQFLVFDLSGPSRPNNLTSSSEKSGIVNASTRMHHESTTSHQPSKSLMSPSSTRGGNGIDEITWCDSLIRTYIVYSVTMIVSCLLGSLFQVLLGLHDHVTVFITLPLSGAMNFYALKFVNEMEGGIDWWHCWTGPPSSNVATGSTGSSAEILPIYSAILPSFGQGEKTTVV